MTKISKALKTLSTLEKVANRLSGAVVW